VVHFSHQRLKGKLHGGTGYAEFPQERRERIKAACPPEVEGAHVIFVAAETDQVLRWLTGVFPTFDMEDASRAQVLSHQGASGSLRLAAKHSSERAAKAVLMGARA